MRIVFETNVFDEQNYFIFFFKVLFISNVVIVVPKHILQKVLNHTTLERAPVHFVAYRFCKKVELRIYDVCTTVSFHDLKYFHEEIFAY